MASDSSDGDDVVTIAGIGSRLGTGGDDGVLLACEEKIACGSDRTTAAGRGRRTPDPLPPMLAAAGGDMLGVNVDRSENDRDARVPPGAASAGEEESGDRGPTANDDDVWFTATPLSVDGSPARAVL
jgi:hypothetical protein